MRSRTPLTHPLPQYRPRSTRRNNRQRSTVTNFSTTWGVTLRSRFVLSPLSRRRFFAASVAGVTLRSFSPGGGTSVQPHDTDLPGPETAPRKVIIDTDTGVEDALALLFAMRSPELKIEAITAVAGNVRGSHGVECVADGRNCRRSEERRVGKGWIAGGGEGG